MSEREKTVLGLGAHPDDLELYCGGTLSRLREEGWRTVICHATNGDKGHQTLSPTELAQIRADEAKKAAAALDAELVMLGFEDACLEATLASRRIFVDLLRKVRPDRVITHSPKDYHPDHAAVAQLLFEAGYLASASLVRTDHPPIESPFDIWLMEPFAGLDFIPERYMDITQHHDKKLEALAMHKSQLEWISEHEGLDLLDIARITSAFRGLQSGVTHAEAFTILRRAPNVIAE